MQSFRGPASSAYGITYVDDFLWLSASRSTLYKLTTTGFVVKSFILPNPRVYSGLCWKAPYLWIANGRAVQQITQSGSVIESFPVTGYSEGVSWDASYLWYSAGTWIYRAEVKFTAVAPASLGKVKTLYR